LYREDFDAACAAVEERALQGPRSGQETIHAALKAPLFHGSRCLRSADADATRQPNQSFSAASQKPCPDTNSRKNPLRIRTCLQARRWRLGSENAVLSRGRVLNRVLKIKPTRQRWSGYSTQNESFSATCFPPCRD